MQHHLSLDDIKVPPGNRLEVLKVERKKQHSINIEFSLYGRFRMH